MFVRWKRRQLRRSRDTAHYAVRQRVVRYLGAIREQYRTAPAHRAWFWACVEQRLAPLGLDSATRQAVEARLAQVEGV